MPKRSLGSKRGTCCAELQFWYLQLWHYGRKVTQHHHTYSVELFAESTRHVRRSSDGHSKCLSTLPFMSYSWCSRYLLMPMGASIRSAGLSSAYQRARNLLSFELSSRTLQHSAPIPIAAFMSIRDGCCRSRSSVAHVIADLAASLLNNGATGSMAPERRDVGTHLEHLEDSLAATICDENNWLNPRRVNQWGKVR
jgi:hypothetical protein